VIEARIKIPAASNSCSPRGKMLLERTHIKKGIQPILLNVIEFGRFSKSSHPEAQQIFRQIMRDQSVKSNADILLRRCAQQLGSDARFRL
jgi:hypothetical protein